jgi:hypothetical protein
LNQNKMARKIISIDCDGILTYGGFVPVELRTNKYYCSLKPQEDAVASLQWLSIYYDIYILSQRCHEDSNLGLRAWLHFVLGLEMDTIAGVITGPSGEATLTTAMDKTSIVRALGCVAHFDDNPRHLEDMEVGILFPSDIPESVAARGVYPTVGDWAGVREFLSTPGMELHGSGGRTIISPSEVYTPNSAKEAMVQ